jgi:polysaccharide pyruvyl transferase WcaK-like protein
VSDLLLEAWAAGLVELARLEWMLGRGERWRPGRPLRLLFAGYNGTRNTGSDVRVEEMIRQIRWILGDAIETSVFTQNFDLTRGYFAGARQVRLPDVFPPAVFREARAHDGVVACEGSMFKSQFANALTTMMVEVLGVASAANRLSVGYGAEAGRMDRSLEWLCRRYVRDSLVITRNEESAARLRALGIRTETGTDTAWTFQPHPREQGAAILRRRGWDGSTPVLVVCPINPFWWPVRPSILKYLARATTGAFADSHYRTIYFHRSGRDVRRRFEAYLDGLARGIARFRRDYACFPALVAMEALDTDACRRLSARLDGAPVFSSLDYDMYELVALLRCGDLMISSRYHGIVTSMPALVPSAGVTMDERIRNLMHERGHAHLLLTVDDPDLGDRVVDVLRALVAEREAVQARIGLAVLDNLKRMARMGRAFEAHVLQRYPDFPVRADARSWEDYLPPLGPELRRLAERHAA